MAYNEKEDAFTAQARIYQIRIRKMILFKTH